MGRPKSEEGAAPVGVDRPCVSLHAGRRAGVRDGERFKVVAGMCGVALYLDTLDGLRGGGLEMLL